MAKALTDAVVKTLKSLKNQKNWREVSDGGCRGLSLRITAKSEKFWVIRGLINGKRERKLIGAYPEVSLEAARSRARAYRAGAKDGVRPEEIDARRKAETLTVERAHCEYITDLEGSLKVHTVTLKKGLYKHHIGPLLGNRLVGSIRSADVAELVTNVATEKGLQIQANRAYSELLALLRWSEAHGYIAGIPTVKRKDLRKVGAAKEQPRRRTLTDDEIAAVWHSVEGLGELTRDFSRLLLLTGQRRDEVRLMTWEEINLKSRSWVIPASRYKTRIAHAVPLSAAAMEVLEARWEEGISGYVLPARDDPEKPFNGHASSLRRLRKDLGNSADFHWHDFRRTVRSGLSRLNIDDRTAEMTIGHLPQGIVAVYDTFDRIAERRTALDRWANLVLGLAYPDDKVKSLDEARGAREQSA